MGGSSFRAMASTTLLDVSSCVRAASILTLPVVDGPCCLIIPGFQVSECCSIHSNLPFPRLAYQRISDRSISLPGAGRNSGHVRLVGHQLRTSLSRSGIHCTPGFLAVGAFRGETITCAPRRCRAHQEYLDRGPCKDPVGRQRQGYVCFYTLQNNQSIAEQIHAVPRCRIPSPPPPRAFIKCIATEASANASIGISRGRPGVDLMCGYPETFRSGETGEYDVPGPYFRTSACHRKAATFSTWEDF